MKRDEGLVRVLLLPVAAIFYTIVKIRHFLYDMGILSSFNPKTATICVGNLTVGGTGKTPHIELLIELLRPQYKLAVLSRGYKRMSKGYREVLTDDTTADAGDEPLQIKQKYPQTVVAVDADRTEGINQITFTHPTTDIILLDDAFQHRKVTAGLNIVLIDYNRPIWEDCMLPAGNLRDTKSQLKRANVVIITKCPACMNPLEKRIMSKHLTLYPYQTLLFSHIEYSQPQPLFESTKPLEKASHNLLISGIAEPTPFLQHMEKIYPDIETIIYPDHYNFTSGDIDKITSLARKYNDRVNIFTTEKDAKRLLSMEMPEELRNYLYFVPIKARLSDDKEPILKNKIDRYVRENTSYRKLHKGTYQK